MLIIPRRWRPRHQSTFTEAISRDEAERELYARQFQSGTQTNARPSVSSTEALVAAFNQTDITSSSDWLVDEMSYGIGRDSFSDLAHSSSVEEDSHNHSPPSTVQPDDFWMPQFGDDGQVSVAQVSLDPATLTVALLPCRFIMSTARQARAREKCHPTSSSTLRHLPTVARRPRPSSQSVLQHQSHGSVAQAIWASSIMRTSRTAL